ncbi:cytochrome-c peroxidase [Xanthobacter aminoxidans]|uniref:Cytochrome c peroxidase n=1 Tax=Xanthobacter aminoxidans TaxID=186280 RepID=A0ABW6ZLK0_9HYPH
MAAAPQHGDKVWVRMDAEAMSGRSRQHRAGRLVVTAAAGLLIALASPRPGVAASDAERSALGAMLFSDPDLSAGRNQSCATCHDPAHGFADPRKDAASGAISLGSDGHARGVRNAPTVSYAASAPRFHRDEQGRYVGGQFLDGRADTLEAQAGGPLLNPVEMAMPSKASVVARLKEKPAYVEAFGRLFGPDVLASDARAFAALTEALAAYERSAEVSPFDSRYDRSLRGEYKMTDQEELGRVLFFSTQFTNCHLCHQIEPQGGGRETFSNYQFHNIGVPANPDLRAPTDHGLRAGRHLKDRRQDGRFKVPTLRNVAVTGPYMHNGVFKDLRTVILFYNSYVTKSDARRIDPETGRPFAPPEVGSTISRKELLDAPALDDKRIDALVAFLKTLTDARYEPLLAP